MEQDRSLWEHFGGGRLFIDAVILAALGSLEYAILSHPSAIQPGEGAVLVMVFAGLLILGRRGISWQRAQALNAFLPDWAGRILRGSRQPVVPPQGLTEEANLASQALNAVLADAQAAEQALAALQESVTRDWREVDACLQETERKQVQARQARHEAADRLAQASSELRAAFEDTLQLDRIELDQRLRADQWRLQAQAFTGFLEQVKAGLGQFENLLEELRDTFPRLLREGDALARLANSGMRHGARMGMAVRGLVAHTPRLLEEAAARTDQFRQFRKAADELRDQAEALGRRMESFRMEATERTRAFGGVQGSLQTVDHAAQQAGLLAVNAAILAQQGGGAAGIQAIGGRLRQLAGQTTRGAAEIERALEVHARGLEHETAGLWDLQEVTESLLAAIQNLLRWAGHLDQQGQELERLLDSEVTHVDQVRQLSEQAELSLHEVGERSHAIETAMGRLWSVEAKLLPELERLTRSGGRLSDAGSDLSRISQQNIEEIWGILGRHREIRRTPAYRQVVTGDLAHLLAVTDPEGESLARMAWARRSREFRLAAPQEPIRPRGTCTPEGACSLQLLGLDPLGMPEPSALQRVSWTKDGREWLLELQDSLRSEEARMNLFEGLRHSDLLTCFPGTLIRIAHEGVRLTLSEPFAQLPRFLAGLDLMLPLSAEALAATPRPVATVPGRIQVVLWTGPDLEPATRDRVRERIHALAQEIPGHHLLLPEAAHAGERPPCPWVG
ncbi:MAG: hypothetical protein KGI56_06420, partial [Acidobacteriota bacterium]|nr:hypothetical protein [Acidobacteriota bacterium]